jgi:hypothetical protein
MERIYERIYNAIAEGERLTGEWLERDPEAEAQAQAQNEWTEDFLFALACCTVIPLVIIAISSGMLILFIPGLLFAIQLALEGAHQVFYLLLRFGNYSRSDSGGYQPFHDDPDEVDPLQF